MQGLNWILLPGLENIWGNQLVKYVMNLKWQIVPGENNFTVCMQMMKEKVSGS